MQAIETIYVTYCFVKRKNMVTMWSHFQEGSTLISCKLHRFCAYIKLSQHDSASGTKSSCMFEKSLRDEAVNQNKHAGSELYHKSVK